MGESIEDELKNSKCTECFKGDDVKNVGGTGT